MSENQGRDFSRYDAMETAELEELLRLDTDAPEGVEPDVELVLYVLEVLEKRNRIKEVTGNKAQEAFESFKQDYFPEDILIEEEPVRKPLHLVRRLTTAAAAVLVFVMLGTVTANAFGFNIWRAVAVWAQENFHLQIGNATAVDDPKPDIELPYESLEDAIYTLEMATGIVPTWIPEGYVLSDITVLENPIQKTYTALYKDGERYLKVSVKSCLSGNPEQIEQGEGYCEMSVVNGVEYYYLTNYDQNRVVWVNGSYECYISGDVTIEQLEKMVDSI